MLTSAQRSGGFTLLEVLITIIILAVGLLGVANLQALIQSAEMESYQRAQAVLLLQDMLDRVATNRAGADDYVTADGEFLGVGDDQVETCTGLAMGVLRDQCEWSNALKGAAETNSAGTAKVGAMINARGCIEVVSAADNVNCVPTVYRVTVVWQGLSALTEPTLTCAEDEEYGGDGYRRAITSEVRIGLPGCGST